MLVHHVRALAAGAAIALTTATASACLVCTPSPSPVPILHEPPVRPSPPTILTWTETDGWRVGIAEYNTKDTFCNRASVYVGGVIPSTSSSWIYYFKHGDGATSQPIHVPGAPNLGPQTKYGVKTVYDTNGPSKAGVADSLVVVENEKAIQTALIPLACR